MCARNCREPHSEKGRRHWIRRFQVIRLIMCVKELPKPRSRKAAARRSLMSHIVAGGLEAPDSLYDALGACKPVQSNHVPGGGPHVVSHCRRVGSNIDPIAPLEAVEHSQCVQ